MIRASSPLPRVSAWARRFTGAAEPEVELIARAMRLREPGGPPPETYDFQPAGPRGGVPVYELPQPPLGLLIPLVAFSLLGFAAPGFWIAAACFAITLGARYARGRRTSS